MPLLMIAAALAPSLGSVPPPCRADWLRIGADPRRGVADFAPVSGMAVSIRNLGPDCSMTALPSISLIDARGRTLPAGRRVPLGIPPGPASSPIVLPGGGTATFELTWPNCKTGDRCARIGRADARFGAVHLKAQVGHAIPSVPVGPFKFDQPPGTTSVTGG